MFKENKESKVFLVKTEQMVPKETEVHKENKEFRVFLVTEVLKESKESKVIQVKTEQMESTELTVPMVLTE